MDTQQPGQVITPQGDDAGAPEPQRPVENPTAAPAPAPVSEPEPTVPAPTATVATDPQPAPAAETPASPDKSWQFHEEGPAPAPIGNLSWTAAEFIEHPKGAGWYGLLAIGGIAAAALVFWLTRDIFSLVIILFATLALGVFAARKPREQQYSLSHQGVQIGTKTYGFQEFRTFSVADEGSVASVVLMPLKRFMPPLTLYVSPDMSDQVIDYLVAILPFEQRKADAVDGLLRRIKF